MKSTSGMRSSQHITQLVVWLCMVGTTFSAFGWNKATHMAIGAIAYRDLKTTAPQTLARIVTILREHPDYRQRWAKPLSDTTLSADEKDEYLLMLAARWPDDVKGQNDPHDHPTWHYVNYVYNPAKGIARTDSVLPGGNLLQAFALNREIVQSNAADSIKAIAICWLFHLTGDAHMPLHTIALISSQFPQGDQGGNLFKIKVTPDGKTINLHALWDGMLLSADDYRSADKLAIQLRHDVTRDTLPLSPKIDMDVWSVESFNLARTIVYRDGQLDAGTGDTGVLLPTDYIQAVKPVAEQQVALSGYRLTDTLLADLGN